VPGLTFTPETGWALALLFIRTGGLAVTAPVLSHRAIPPLAKIGLAAALAVAMLPSAQAEGLVAPVSLGSVVEGVLRETLFGLLLGLAMNLVFVALHMGSRLAGVQVGFSIGGVLDPVTGNDSAALDQFYSVLAVLIFFAVSGHLVVVATLAETVRAVPPGTFDPFGLSAAAATSFGAGLVVTAVRIAMPVVAALLLVDVGLGIAARTVPQMQVLLVGLPVKVGVGLLVLGAAMPVTTYLMRGVIEGPLAGASLRLLGVQ
jgi:flagellar biosynthesis protein FliR